MEKLVHLRLYGEISHEGEDGNLAWQLYQSPALTRLRDVSLSSAPSRFSPHGTAASRFEHSVGVGYLARKLCDWRQPLAEHRKTLLAAALCHDIGSPPFSHISELFFWDMCGLTHEQETDRMLQPSRPTGALLAEHGVDPAEVADTINGRHPLLGPLICGSIDLDNIDNSLHLLLSLGYRDEQPYHPLRLLKAFRIREGQAALDTSLLSEILGWQEGRRLLYDVLQSEPNLSSATMLYRALEYAYAGGRLDAGFFRLGESRAMEHLLENCGGEAARLVGLALSWKHFPMIYQSTSAVEDPRLASLYDDWKARKRFADRLADDLGMRRGDLALYVGRDRGEKLIDLPFVGKRSEAVADFFRYRRGEQRLSIFAEKSYRPLAGSSRLERALSAALNDLPEKDPEQTHVFF